MNLTMHEIWVIEKALEGLFFFDDRESEVVRQAILKKLRDEKKEMVGKRT